jgi:hypothetical protein
LRQPRELHACDLSKRRLRWQSSRSVRARMPRRARARRVLGKYARAVEEAATRLRELRLEEWEDLGLALALGLAPVAAEVRPAFALPLFVGGLVVGPWAFGLCGAVGISSTG